MEQKVRGLRLGNGGQRCFIAVDRQHPRGNGLPYRANDGVGAEVAVACSGLAHRLGDDRVYLEARGFYGAVWFGRAQRFPPGQDE
jgi:hypothetical protein